MRFKFRGIQVHIDCLFDLWFLHFFLVLRRGRGWWLLNLWLVVKLLVFCLLYILNVAEDFGLLFRSMTHKLLVKALIRLEDSLEVVHWDHECVAAMQR